MDARLWHLQVSVPPTAAPPPLPLAEIRAMNPTARSTYLRARRRWLGSLRVETAENQEAKQKLTDLVQANDCLPPGAKGVIAVTAPFAVGKSTLVREWAQGKYLEILGDRAVSPELPSWEVSPGAVADEIPVVWVDLMAAAKVRAFNIQVLQYLGYPIGGAIHDLTTRLARAIETHRVRLLVVDDSNLLNLRHRDARDVLDHLKYINTILGQRGATMALVGANLQDSLISKDPQLAGRLQDVCLRPLPVDTEQDTLAWQRVLRAMERSVLPYLPLAHEGLLQADHAPRLWRLTQGYLGDLVRLVAEAAHHAALDDTWTIRVKDLEHVQLSRRAREAAIPNPPPKPRTNPRKKK